MSVEILRRAAAKVRERAEAATPGAWEAGEWCVWSTTGPDPYVVHDGSDGDGGAFTPENAAHIASWHPTVALAAARSLDQHAEEHDVYDCNWGDACASLALARAYLGESE